MDNQNKSLGSALENSSNGLVLRLQPSKRHRGVTQFNLPGRVSTGISKGRKANDCKTNC